MKYILTTLLAVALSAAAQAGTPVAKNPKAPVAPAPAPDCDAMSYRYAELGWLHQDHQFGTSDGGYLDLSYEVANHFFVDGTFSLTGGDLDYREVGAGVGYYLPLTKKFHFVGRTGWSNVDTDLTSDVNEWYVSPGLRLQVTCNLELYTKVYYHVPEVGDNNWSVGVGALYHLCKAAALTVGGAWGEDDEWSIQTGIRFNL
jgi:hypothetical protein